MLRRGYTRYVVKEVLSIMATGVAHKYIIIDRGVRKLRHQQSEWIMEVLDMLKAKPDIVHTGFEQSGITHAVRRWNAMYRIRTRQEGRRGLRVFVP